MLTSYGCIYIKNTVKTLIKNSHSWHGNDSALAIFTQFRDRFYEND
jgi:hypothetical protein